MRNLYKRERSYQSALKQWRQYKSTPFIDRREFEKLYNSPEVSRRYQDYKLLGIKKSRKDIIMENFFGSKHNRESTQNRLRGIKEGLAKRAYEGIVDEEDIFTREIMNQIENLDVKVTKRNYEDVYNLLNLFYNLVNDLELILSPKEYSLA